MNLVQKLHETLASTYAIYLKTQNYYWNADGCQFLQLRNLFKSQYREIAKAIDAIAENIRMLNSKIPSSFEIFECNSVVAPGDEDMNSTLMIEDLHESHKVILKLLEDVLNIAQEMGNEIIVDLVINRMKSHAKIIWMLSNLLATD